jgi:hypothetical protein
MVHSSVEFGAKNLLNLRASEFSKKFSGVIPGRSVFFKMRKLYAVHGRGKRQLANKFSAGLEILS